jgi:hypothetical protein
LKVNFDAALVFAVKAVKGVDDYSQWLTTLQTLDKTCAFVRQDAPDYVAGDLVDV